MRTVGKALGEGNAHGPVVLVLEARSRVVLNAQQSVSLADFEDRDSAGIAKAGGCDLHGLGVVSGRFPPPGWCSSLCRTPRCARGAPACSESTFKTTSLIIPKPFKTSGQPDDLFRLFEPPIPLLRWTAKKTPVRWEVSAEAVRLQRWQEINVLLSLCVCFPGIHRWIFKFKFLKWSETMG